MTSSYHLFVVNELVASAVCVVAEVKTTSGFIGLQQMEHRAWLSAWTVSLRALGMAAGNFFGWYAVQTNWATGPSTFCLLLCVSGLLCLGVIQAKGVVSCEAAS